MFRRAAFGAVAALTVGVLAVGCSEDGDTVVGGGATSARPDAFPGSQVDVSNVAEDGRALTPSGQSFQSGQMYFNNANGEGMLLFVARNDQGTNATFALYASFFDGTRFYAPVQIRGNDSDAADRAQEDPEQVVNGYKLLFLNPTGQTDPDAAARAGDAIILFTRLDRDLTANNATATDEEANRRLWATYFDRSELNANAANGVIRGIQTNAQVIDTDNQFSPNPAQDPSVSQFGFSSDSLAYTHSFSGGVDGVESGQPTSYVHIFFGKQTGSATATAPAIRVVTFDITQTGNAFPASSTGTNLPFAGVTPQASTGADLGANDPVVVHNNVVIWSATNVNVTDADDVVQASVLPTTATGGSATTVLLGSDLTANANDQSLMPNARDVYGPDHGLALLYALFLENNFNAAAATTGRSNDTDVVVAALTLTGTPTREVREVDLFTNALGTGISNGATPRGAVASLEGTRINRSGDFITVLMLQDNNNTDGATIQVNDVLVVNVVQTRKAGTTSARTLQNAVATPVVAPSLGFPAPNAVGDAQTNVFAVAFQQDLAQGRSPANGGGNADRACIFQGNHNRVNFHYQQRDTQVGATVAADDVRLFTNGIRVVPGANDTTAPTFALVSTGQTVVETVDVNYFSAAPTPTTAIPAVMIDGGDDTRTTGANPAPTDASGRPLIFFVSQEVKVSNFDAAGTPAGSFIELRLFASDNGATPTIISTNPTTSTLEAFEVPNAAPTVISVPVNENTTQSPSHVGNRAHILWQENVTNFATMKLATRSYALDKSEGTTTAFAERFTPTLTTADPVTIDNPADRPLLTGQALRGTPAVGNGLGLGGNVAFDGLTVVRNGETVGVFFDEDQRLYYQQTSGTANDWYKDAGVADPQLVDNESDRVILDYEIVSPPKCNNLPGTLVFFMKATETTSDYVRVQVRELN